MEITFLIYYQMIIEPLELNGAYYIEPEVHTDTRGFFFEWFQRERFKKETGIDFDIAQFNCSKSAQGVLRGLHYQLNPHAQSKLVAVNRGEVQDVIVDVRMNSKTYGRHYSIILSEKKKNQLFIPKGFAHGFLVLSSEAEFFYAVDNVYDPGSDRGILYKDESLNIDWGVRDLIVSKKDMELPSFLDAENNFH